MSSMEVQIQAHGGGGALDINTSYSGESFTSTVNKVWRSEMRSFRGFDTLGRQDLAQVMAALDPVVNHELNETCTDASYLCAGEPIPHAVPEL